MAVVKINAIDVPPGGGEELEKRFAARARAVENSPGFLGFELLRPVAGDNRYFVYTRWETEQAYQDWAAGPPEPPTPPRPEPSSGHRSPRVRLSSNSRSCNRSPDRPPVHRC